MSVFVSSILFGASAVLAADDGAFGLNNTAVQAGYETKGATASVSGRVQTIISVALGFVATLFFGLVLYGGIYWMTARGKDEHVAKAKEILESAIIGLVLVTAAYAIATFVLGRLTAEPLGCCVYKDPAIEVRQKLENIPKSQCDTKPAPSWAEGNCSS
jgi:cbb3-type cytochrome oxidase subunit 3